MEPCSEEQGEAPFIREFGDEAWMPQRSPARESRERLAGDGGCELPKREPLRTSPS